MNISDDLLGILHTALVSQMRVLLSLVMFGLHKGTLWKVQAIIERIIVLIILISCIIEVGDNSSVLH